VIEQLALIEQPATEIAEPKLTDRQQFALRIVKDAGPDGVTSDEVGAAWCAQNGKHTVDTRCQWDGSNGRQVLKALEKRGLVKYRRRTATREGGWVAIGAQAAAAPSSQDDGWTKLLEAGF
jgi:hypothetical protein